MMQLRGEFLTGILAIAICAGAAAPALADNLPPPPPSLYNPGMSTAQARTWQRTLTQRKVLALRSEALRLRDADGGALTPDHLAYLQAKLDRIRRQPPL